MSKFKRVSIDAVFGSMERQLGDDVGAKKSASDIDARDDAAHSAVIPAKAGIQYAAAYPVITIVTAYWIARSSRAMTPGVRRCSRGSQ
ncbi:hypothetical protein E4K66_33680 [Bradyrhizobium frederickii]|uniref:Uncharacterized protein n=1 Tax=Bradyrhizobium frederickii TaxID=2560054 RepID=A0A4Y9KS86_9BRAD|nr:hypothetical protein [Bradyrhizobium frederickii]TFV30713.1 hypothetical protein E4K66_33680 [Bradyrhizobium frederickii]